MRNNVFFTGDINSLNIILFGLKKHLVNGGRLRDYRFGRCGFNYPEHFIKDVADWFVGSMFAIENMSVSCDVANYFLTHVFSSDSTALLIEHMKGNKTSNEHMEKLAGSSTKIRIKISYYARLGNEKKRLKCLKRIETMHELKDMLRMEIVDDRDARDEYLRSLDVFNLPDEAKVIGILNENGTLVVFFRQTGHYGRGEELIEIPVEWLYVK